MAIAVEAADQSTTTSNTFSFTVPSITNGILLVGNSVNESNPANRAITGITYNGVALTKIDAMDTGAGSTRTELWYLINPPAGTANIVITYSGTGAPGGRRMGVLCLSGVDQSNPINASNKASGSTSSATVSVTPTTDNCWVVASACAQAVLTESGGNTERWYSNVSSTNNGAGGTKGPISPAAATAMAWGLDHGDEWRLVSAAIAPAAAITPKRSLMGVGT
jgi:hypothetical protein